LRSSVASVENALPFDRARTPDRSSIASWYLIEEQHGVHTDHVVRNFHVEGPFLSITAYRDVSKA